jgi:hypothetical protein
MDAPHPAVLSSGIKTQENAMFDAHMHYAASHGDVLLEGILKENGIRRFALQCIPQMDTQPTTPDALRFKVRHPGVCYVLGELSRPAYARFQHDVAALGDCLVSQARMLMASGCDGIKLLEGKPDIRRKFPIPDFDSPAWAPFWAYAEAEGIPLTLHLNDPPEFWDLSRMNPYAIREGWFYGEDCVNNQAQYRQLAAVFARHPGLKMQLAHFYFLYDDLPLLARMLEDYPRLYLDLTPGIEIYYSLSRQAEAARAFFRRFSTRILFGTDIGSRAAIARPPRAIDALESAARVCVIRQALETVGPYTLKPDGRYLFNIPERELNGLGLDEALRHQIYGANALTYYGPTPRPVPEGAIEALEAHYRGFM